MVRVEIDMSNRRREKMIDENNGQVSWVDRS